MARRAGLATQYKPVLVGNRVEGLGQDFVNENIGMVRKLSFDATSDPDDYEVVMFSCWMKQAALILSPVSGTIVLFDSRTHRVQKSQKEPVSLSLGGLLDPVGSEVEHGRTMTELQLMMRRGPTQELPGLVMKSLRKMDIW